MIILLLPPGTEVGIFQSIYRPATGRTTVVRFSVEARFSLLQNIQTGYGIQADSHPMGTEVKTARGLS
jgi:hypothetical protein